MVTVAETGDNRQPLPIYNNSGECFFLLDNLEASGLGSYLNSRGLIFFQTLEPPRILRLNGN